MAATSAKKPVRTKVVYIAYTRSGNYHLSPTLLKVYAKSSYQVAYDWLADIADRYGTRVYPGTVAADGRDLVAAVVNNPDGSQSWWLERHEVV